MVISWHFQNWAMQDDVWPVPCLLLHLWEESVHTEPSLNFQFTNTTCLFHSEFTCAFFHSQAVRNDICMWRFKSQAWESLFLFMQHETGFLHSAHPTALHFRPERPWEWEAEVHPEWGSQWIPRGRLLETPEGVPQCSCLVPSYPNTAETFNWGRQVLTRELQMAPSLAEWHYKLTCKFQSKSHCTRNLCLDKWIPFTEFWNCY